MKSFLKTVLTLLLVAAAVFAASRLIKTRPQARRAAQKARPPLVEVIAVQAAPGPVEVTAMGTVVPARRLVVQPEVSGRIISSHEALVPGGRIFEGEEIVRIDVRTYELAAEQQRAAVAKAEVELELEAGKRILAEEEWKLFESEVPFSDEGRRLALRKPQERNAEIAMEVARTGLKQAELNLERTSVTAPFNGLVIEESVETGQLVTPQSRLATLVGTDEFWVRIAIPPERTGLLVFPDVKGQGGSVVRITQETGGREAVPRRGRLLRLLADLEPAGRMARVVVAVEDPLGNVQEGGVPLLLGSYVRVVIEGRRLENIVSVPRTALKAGDTIWVLRSDSRLEIRSVDIAWSGRDRIFISRGLSAGEMVVTGTVANAVDGMQLRTSADSGTEPGAK
jgi:RND family efflux transporter MFP subunit